MMKHILNEPPCKIMTGSQIPKSIFDHCLCGQSYINFVFNYVKKYFFKYFEANDFLYQDFI